MLGFQLPRLAAQLRIPSTRLASSTTSIWESIADHCATASYRGARSETAASAIAKAVSITTNSAPTPQQAATVAQWVFCDSHTSLRCSIEFAEAAVVLSRVLENTKPKGIVNAVTMCQHGATLAACLEWARPQGALCSMRGLEQAAAIVGTSIAKRVLSNTRSLPTDALHEPTTTGTPSHGLGPPTAPMVPPAHLSALLQCNDVLLGQSDTPATRDTLVSYACLAALLQAWHAVHDTGTPSASMSIWQLLQRHNLRPSNSALEALAAASLLTHPQSVSQSALLAVLSASDATRAISNDTGWHSMVIHSLLASNTDGQQQHPSASLFQQAAATVARRGESEKLWLAARDAPITSSHAFANPYAATWASHASAVLASSLLATHAHSIPAQINGSSPPGQSQGRHTSQTDSGRSETAAEALQALLAPLMPPSSTTIELWAGAVGFGEDGRVDATGNSAKHKGAWDLFEDVAEAASASQTDLHQPAFTHAPPDDVVHQLLRALLANSGHTPCAPGSDSLVCAAEEWALTPDSG